MTKKEGGSRPGHQQRTSKSDRQTLWGSISSPLTPNWVLSACWSIAHIAVLRRAFRAAAHARRTFVCRCRIFRSRRSLISIRAPDPNPNPIDRLIAYSTVAAYLTALCPVQMLSSKPLAKPRKSENPARRLCCVSERSSCVADSTPPTSHRAQIRLLRLLCFLFSSSRFGSIHGTRCSRDTYELSRFLFFSCLVNLDRTTPPFLATPHPHHQTNNPDSTTHILNNPPPRQSPT